MRNKFNITVIYFIYNLMWDNIQMDNINEYLNKNVYRVIEGMVNDLLLNQPEDVVEFMIVWLKEKGNQVLMGTNS